MYPIQIGDKTFELYLEKEMISKRTRLLGIQLNVDYEGRCPILIGVLNGSFLFMAGLVKEMDIACEVSFIRLSSYEGTERSDSVKKVLGLQENLKDRDVILVEDIVDTGATLRYILKEVYRQEPASVAVCSLLLKPDSLTEEISEIKYVGFEIANDFVVGHGLDYNGLGRNLNSIYVLTS